MLGELQDYQILIVYGMCDIYVVLEECAEAIRKRTYHENIPDHRKYMILDNYIDIRQRAEAPPTQRFLE
jgi:hypothetical protein